MNKVRIEGCLPTEDDQYETGGCSDCSGGLGFCDLCKPGYAEISKPIGGIDEKEKKELLKKVEDFEKNDPNYEKKMKEFLKKKKTSKGNKGKNHYDEKLDEELRDYGRRKNNAGHHYVECKKCKEGCIHCYPDMLCTECSEGYALIRGTCLKLSKEAKRKQASKCKKKSKDGKWCFDCPKGQNFSYQLGKCVICPENCNHCESSVRCRSCDKGYHLSNGRCKLCEVPGCLNCFESPRTCLRCMRGFYFSLTTQRCERCHESCAECSGPQERDCLSCQLVQVKVEYSYDEVPGAVAQKILHNFELRHPEYIHMPMLQRFILHIESDAYCKEYCEDPENLTKHHGVFDNENEFTNNCPIIHGKHPQEVYDSPDEVKFEYGGHHTDDIAEKEYEDNVHERAQKERVKKHVEKELAKEGFKRHTDAANRHHIGRKEYEKLVKDVKEKHKDQIEMENRQREDHRRQHQSPHGDGASFVEESPSELHKHKVVIKQNNRDGKIDPSTIKLPKLKEVLEGGGSIDL